MVVISLGFLALGLLAKMGFAADTVLAPDWVRPPDPHRTVRRR